MCPANSELEMNDPEEPVDFQCQVAHLRAVSFEWQIAPHGECEYCEGGGRREKLVSEAAGLGTGKTMLPAYGGLDVRCP